MQRMNILFVHQNFPGQFKNLAPALALRGHKVSALSMRKQDVTEWNGVRLFSYLPSRGSTPNIHPWLVDFETKVIRAEACFKEALRLRQDGFIPDLIIAHPGWGESLFLKEVWPKAKLGIYCEFYYHPEGADVGFDPEFPPSDPSSEPLRIKLKNLNNLLHFEIADAGISPTEWQKSTYPQPFREKITVIHDGIDTDLASPNEQVAIKLSDSTGRSILLSRKDKIITFVNRNLEPYRGYHIFMRALPQILNREKEVRVLIVGGDGVSYGAPPDPKKYGRRTWKEIFLEEVKSGIGEDNLRRIHFLGHIAYEQFLSVLQVSTVHVYLTYPFVLSWSLLEAMSVGCAIVASDTEPVREVIEDGRTGILVNFFDVDGLAERICSLLNDPERRKNLGKNARMFVKENYDLRTVCLPRQIKWVEELLG